MASPVGTPAALWTTYILRKYVPQLQHELPFGDYAEPAQIPKHAGAYVARWKLPVVTDTTYTSAITDASAGTTNEVTSVTINSIEATIGIYGEFHRVGDLAEATWLSEDLDIYGEWFVERGARLINDQIRNAALTTTNFLHSRDTTTGGATLAVGEKASITDFAAIAGFFRSQGARGWDSLLGDFVWIIHPDQETDLITEFTTTRMSWADTQKHVPVGYEQLIKNHRFVGRYGGTVAVRSQRIGTITEDVTAYNSVALARYGVGWLGLGDSGPKKPMIKIKRPGPNDTSQPLDLYMTIGWKFRAVARLLDVARALRVYSSTT